MKKQVKRISVKLVLLTTVFSLLTINRNAAGTSAKDSKSNIFQFEEKDLLYQQLLSTFIDC